MHGRKPKKSYIYDRNNLHDTNETTSAHIHTSGGRSGHHFRHLMSAWRAGRAADDELQRSQLPRTRRLGILRAHSPHHHRRPRRRSSRTGARQHDNALSAVCAGRSCRPDGHAPHLRPFDRLCRRKVRYRGALAPEAALAPSRAAAVPFGAALAAHSRVSRLLLLLYASVTQRRGPRDGCRDHYQRVVAFG